MARAPALYASGTRARAVSVSNDGASSAPSSTRQRARSSGGSIALAISAVRPASSSAASLASHALRGGPSAAALGASAAAEPVDPQVGKAGDARRFGVAHGERVDAAIEVCEQPRAVPDVVIALEMARDGFGGIRVGRLDRGAAGQDDRCRQHQGASAPRPATRVAGSPRRWSRRSRRPRRRATAASGGGCARPEPGQVRSAAERRVQRHAPYYA